MGSGLLESIDRSTQLAGHNRLALLLFRLGGRQIFGINVFKVQEVLPRPALSWTPGAHPLVCGVADLRRRMVPVIDLARAIGELPASKQAAHLIVCEYNRSVQGFLVQSVDRIIHVDVSQVQPPPGGEGEGYLTAITRHGQELVQIIDVEKVLTDVAGAAPELSETVIAEAQSLPTHKHKILVADDSRVARSQIERVLRQIGMDVVLVNNGREALRHLQNLSEQPGPLSDRLLMVISDVEMPDMDGYTLTSEIRRDARLKDIPVVLHTSLSGGFNHAMVDKVGANRFIAKFGSDDLARAVLEQVALAA